MTAPSTSPAVGDPVTADLLAALVAAALTGASGTATITPTAANTPTSLAITFPAGRFTSAPNVQVTAQTTVPGTQVTGVAVTSVTASGCILWLTATNTSARSLNWLAVDTP